MRWPVMNPAPSQARKPFTDGLDRDFPTEIYVGGATVFTVMPNGASSGQLRVRPICAYKDGADPARDNAGQDTPTRGQPRPDGGRAVKTIGLLGGMSWESSIVYEQIINQEVRARLAGCTPPAC
jgi:hypothetical protein